MKLRRSTILQGIETLLTQDIKPLLTDDFAANDVRMAAALLEIDRADRENAVALLVEEHARLRALFADAAGHVADAALARQLAEAGAAATGDLRLSALEAETAALRRLLVSLHEHVETRTDGPATRLAAAVWRAIRDTERARNPSA